jgi:DNA-binding NarL/FixJ family response regulator
MTPHILLADDHPLVRRGVREILAEAFPRATLDEVASAAELMNAVRSRPPDLILLDLSLPDRHGLECLADLRARGLTLPVLVLTMHADERFALRALELGANGYLNKDRAVDEVVGAVRRVLAGGRYIGAETAELLAGRAFGGSPALHEQLSRREFSVLRELALGRSVSEIAERLHLSPKTVSTYRSRLLEKLNLATNADLTRYCLAHQIIE